jgi:hypothetical protein
MGVKEHLSEIAKNLIKELEPVLEIKGVTGNSDLLGKFTEAAIKNLIQRIVHPLRISTGTVFDYPIANPLRQIDVIIWSSFPVPALFNIGDFGLVPKSSAFGVIEIKRSNYSAKAVKSISDFMNDVKSRKIVSESPWSDKIGDSRPPGIGIICLIEKQISKKLQKLFDDGEVIAIFNYIDGKLQIRKKDVILLLNFLQYIMWRYNTQSSFVEKYIALPSKKVDNPTIYKPPRKPREKK